ncbi:MAG TPA: peptidoglycan DD-metalloendopeptidase family protein [Tabrizicola sp.]|nr:peptidoglycan DD-metalloendopeptidase family protein [Tabrizicola sp.]
MRKTCGSLHLTLTLGVSVLALSGCIDTGNLDWDLRRNAGSTSEAARQATASPPTPDANGIISYPDYQLAQARRGDTVASLAGRLGLNPEDLARSNALQSGDSLREGELLLLPSRVSATQQPATAGGTAGGSVDITAIATTALDEAGPSATTTASQPIAGQPLTHRVARGETAFTIARAYNVSAKALADWNQLGPDMDVREGQTLIIPIATGPAPDPEPEPTAPGVGSPTPEPPSAAEPLPDEDPTPAGAKPEETPVSPNLGEEASAASAAKFAMPAEGAVIRGYNKKSNQGIDIAAAAGSAVKAAEAGTVTVISADTNGKGIVIVRHAGDLLTVYVGVSDVSVAKGAKVKRGQSIGKVAAGDPAFLHFEVRNTSKESFDPMTYLQ